MVDFNNSKLLINRFSGSEKKVTVLYNNDIWMLKFPDPIRDKGNKMSYMNNQFSEYMGCKIFQLLGFNTQEVALGWYSFKGSEKFVVGCKDFTNSSSKLYEFSKLANTVETKTKTSIEFVYEILNDSIYADIKDELIDKFWKMFVVDCLIGNWDRHLDNWGIVLYDGVGLQFAPIYDCGSSLSALLSEEKMNKLLGNTIDFKNEEYNVKSCYSDRGKRIFYHEIFKNPPYSLEVALRSIFPIIDMNKIYGIIENTPNLSTTREEYLKKAITIRYENIIKPAFSKLDKLNSANAFSNLKY